MRQTMRIVTICSSGGKAKSVARNPNRIKLLQHIMHSLILQSEWKDIDAVLFAGGYFFYNKFLGNLPYQQRKEELEKANFTKDIRMLAQMLHINGSPDAKVILGVDTKYRSDWENGDEFCVAYDKDGIAGIGRKVFPVDADTNLKELKRAIAVYYDDFDDTYRIISLPCSRNVLLCACYDMFGVNVYANSPSPRKNYIKYMYYKGELLKRDSPNFKRILNQRIAAWQNMLTKHEVEAVLSSIHRFNYPNAELYWQRHGIATASAAMGGKLAIAAANYRDYLPEADEAPLAAFNVATQHITAGNHRKAEPFHAKDSLPELEIDNEAAIIRLFEVPI